jgi:hypothetical protein
METRAGDMTIHLPLGWLDAQQYTFYTEDEKLSLHISRLTVTADSTVEQLLLDREERLTPLFEVKVISRNTNTTVDNRPAGTANILLTDAENDIQDRSRILVVKSDPTHAISAALIGPVHLSEEIDQAWDLYIAGLTFKKGF